MLMAVCIVLPLVLAASRAWGARRGQVERGLLRHPLRREVRPHLRPGPQHLAVLPAARRRRRRRWHALRPDLALPGRRPVRPHDRRLRRRPAPAGGVGARPSPARQPGHQRARGPVLGLPRPPARPHLHPRHRGGRARLTTGWRVVRPQRRPQLPAQRSLPEREQRRRLPAAGRQRANAHRRQRRPAEPLRRLRLAGPGPGRRTDRRGDRRLPRQPARHQQRPRQPPRDRHRRRPLRLHGPPQAGQRHGRRSATSCAAASRSPRSGTTATPTNRTCTCRSRTPRQAADADRTYPIVFRNVHITRGGHWPWADSRRGPHRRPRLPRRTRPPAPATCTRSTARPRTSSARDPAHRPSSSWAAWAPRRPPGTGSAPLSGPMSGPAPGTTPASATPPAHR